MPCAFIIGSPSVSQRLGPRPSFANPFTSRSAIGASYHLNLMDHSLITIIESGLATLDYNQVNSPLVGSPPRCSSLLSSVSLSRKHTVGLTHFLLLGDQQSKVQYYGKMIIPECWLRCTTICVSQCMAVRRMMDKNVA